jgi:ubiquinol-cytochrome c reductase cytochrome b subunit
MEPIFGGVATTQPRNPTAANAPNVVLDPTLVQRGKTLFSQNGCAGCHKLAGQGGAVGPPLDGEGSRRPDLNWQMQHLKNPASMVQGSTMPPFNQLSAQDLKALSAFLLSLK